MRVTSGHSANRRSHHALSEPGLSACSNCGEKHLRHTACTNCGQYRGRVIFDVLKRANRLIAKKDAKAKAKQDAPADEKEKAKEDKTLDVESLSKR